MAEEDVLLDRLLTAIRHQRSLKPGLPLESLDLGAVSAPLASEEASHGRSVADLHRELVEAEAELRERAPGVATFWGVSPARCQDLEEVLRHAPEIHVLQYFICMERLIIFVTSSEGTWAAHVTIPQGQVSALVETYRHSVWLQGVCQNAGLESVPVTDSKVRESARALFDLLIAPVQSYIPSGSRICIIPHGPLHYMPYSCLMTPEGSLVADQYEVTYAVSLSVFMWCHSRPAEQWNTSIAAFSNPTLNEPGGELPMAEEQSRSLAGLLPHVRLFARERATLENFWKYAPEAGVLTLDLHNAHDPGNPLETALRFAASPKTDGLLSLETIYRCGRGKTRGRLVVAAVCDGNLGEIGGWSTGDDLATLARSLHYMGYSSVVTSLWPINDLCSWLLTEEIFKQLQPRLARSEALPVAAALQNAQRKVADLTAEEALDRCLAQRERAEKEDETGLRPAWIDYAALAWLERQAGNFKAARIACERAMGQFTAAHGPGWVLDDLRTELEALNRDERTCCRTPDYTRKVFSSPYYWGAFVLLGGWAC